MDDDYNNSNNNNNDNNSNNNNNNNANRDARRSGNKELQEGRVRVLEFNPHNACQRCVREGTDTQHTFSQ